MWVELLSQLHACRVGLCFEAQEDGLCPAFPGAALRGAFGAALRGSTCATGAPTCDDCPVVEQCTYAYLFETPIPADARRMRLYTHAPHPFVLRAPQAPRGEDAGEWEAGQQIDVELVLFGRGIDALPEVIFALAAAGQRGLGPSRTRLALRHAELRELADDGALVTRPLFDGETLAPPPYGVPLRRLLALREGECGAPALRNVALALRSPARVVHQGKLARSLPLHVVVRSLLRRVSAIADFHGALSLDADFAGLVRAAETVVTVQESLSWTDQHRRSARQGREHALGGVVGHVEYADVPPALASLLAVGTLTHLGKGTAFGLGHYSVGAASTVGAAIDPGAPLFTGGQA